MNNCNVFIGTPGNSYKQSCKNMFLVSVSDLFFRICISFVPPLFKKFQKTQVDLLGPLIGFIIFICVLQYGHNNKNEIIAFSPITFCFGYLIIVPLICKALLNISQSNIKYFEIISLLGYALYGHILSLSVSLILFDEASNRFFFFCLVFFCGSSTFRLTIILLKSIPKPGIRLLVCSLVCIIQILSLIFVHFAYMHRTYRYNFKLLQQL